MITCTRKIEFDYGHRVFKHGSKCKHIHGHRGVIEVTATLEQGLIYRLLKTRWLLL